MVEASSQYLHVLGQFVASIYTCWDNFTCMRDSIRSVEWLDEVLNNFWFFGSNGLIPEGGEVLSVSFNDIFKIDWRNWNM